MGAKVVGAKVVAWVAERGVAVGVSTALVADMVVVREAAETVETVVGLVEKAVEMVVWVLLAETVVAMVVMRVVVPWAGVGMGMEVVGSGGRLGAVEENVVQRRDEREETRVEAMALVATAQAGAGATVLEAMAKVVGVAMELQTAQNTATSRERWPV